MKAVTRKKKVTTYVMSKNMNTWSFYEFYSHVHCIFPLEFEVHHPLIILIHCIVFFNHIIPPKMVIVLVQKWLLLPILWCSFNQVNSSNVPFQTSN